MYCSKCGAPNADDARFCSKCGALLGVPAVPAGGPSHLDTNGDGVPDILESPTMFVGSSEETVVANRPAEPTSVMEAPQSELDATRMAPGSARQQAPAPAPVPSPPQQLYRYDSEPESAKRGGRGALIALLVLAVLACAGFGVKYSLDYRARQRAAEQARLEQEEADRLASEQAAVEAELEARRQPHGVVLPLSAPGLDSAGTRIPVRITGSDFEGNTVDLSGYIEADGSGISLPKGRYEFAVLASPIAEDGTLYKIPNGTFPVEIPENIAAGSEFHAPGTLVLSPYEPGEEPEGTLDSALAYALADPEMDDDTAASLADKAGEASARAAREAAEREARDALETAIEEARGNGYVVLSGTVHVMSGRELCEHQGQDLEALFGEQWARTEEETTYIIVEFDHETALDCQSGDGSGLRPGNATMISLTKQDSATWEAREGQTVVIAVNPDETWWPSDVSLPLGEPRTPHVQVIE